MVQEGEASSRVLPSWLRRRGIVLFVGTTLYAAAAGLSDAGDDPRSAWLAALVAVLVACMATRPAASSAERREPNLAGNYGAYATWGLALTIVALGGDAPLQVAAADFTHRSVSLPWRDALAAVGSGVSILATLKVLGVTARPLGAAASLPPPSALFRRLTFVGVPVAALLVVLLVVSARARGAAGGVDASSLAHLGGMLDLAALAAVFAERLHAHRCVVGAAERARGGLGFTLAVAVVATFLALVRSGGSAADWHAAAASAAAFGCVCASAKDPIRIARWGRRATALGLFGGPVVLLAVIASRAPGSSVAATLLGGAAALAVGTLGAWLERPLRPGEGRWLDAVSSAHTELTHAEPASAVPSALRALRAAAGPSASSPELWALDPVRVTTVDAAGYAREREGQLPEQLLGLAADEPEQTVLAPLLDALLVRRPDLRALSRWMDERGALAASVARLDGQASAVLVVPRGSRSEPVTLEEARAFRALAEAMSGACLAKSALARALRREREATARAETAELELERRRHEERLQSERLAAEVAREMRGAETGRYSPRMRFVLTALERRMELGAAVFVVSPPGLDAVPYLAAAHGHAAPRRGRPFVVVDGTASFEHEARRWEDAESSPLALAHGGVLVLADAASLPAEVQRLVARAHAERRAPWPRAEPLDFAIAVTSTFGLAELAATSRLEPTLAARLGDAADCEIALPRLEDRPEDLRALLGDRLAREGLRQRGAPVGIDDAAFARIANYDFPGDYAELILIARRLVEGLNGEVVRASDVEALGLRNPAPHVNVRATTGLS